MLAVTLGDVEAAIRAAWSLETCDESDRNEWSKDNPARGQCGATALTLHDLLGGDLLVAEVLRPDGTRQGYHWWNRLISGAQIDLTREQFAASEVVQEPRVVQRPSGLPRRGAGQYLRLRRSIFAALGIDISDDQLEGTRRKASPESRNGNISRGGST